MTSLTRLGPVQRTRRLVLALTVLGLLPLLAVTASTWVDGGPEHEGIEQLGTWLIVICVLGRADCTLYIGGRKSNELVTIGPYSVCRNPLYLFSLIGTLGVGFLYGSLVVGLTFGLVYFFVFDRLIRREEVFLEDSFPLVFAEYQSVTPRWVPKLGQWRGVDEIVVRPRLVYNTLRDAAVFVLMIPLFEAVEWLQQIKILPVLLQLP